MAITSTGDARKIAELRNSHWRQDLSNRLPVPYDAVAERILDHVPVQLCGMTHGPDSRGFVGICDKYAEWEITAPSRADLRAVICEDHRKRCGIKSPE